MSGYKDDDIQGVFRKETTKKRFGPDPDPEKVAERQAIREQWRSDLETMTWKEYEAKVIEKIGAKPGTEAYERYRLLYRQYQVFLEERRRNRP